jgi:hypothetical protein
LAVRSRSESFPLFSTGRSYTGSDVCFKQRTNDEIRDLAAVETSVPEEEKAPR